MYIAYQVRLFDGILSHSLSYNSWKSSPTPTFPTCRLQRVEERVYLRVPLSLLATSVTSPLLLCTSHTSWYIPPVGWVHCQLFLWHGGCLLSEHSEHCFLHGAPFALFISDCISDFSAEINVPSIKVVNGFRIDFYPGHVIPMIFMDFAHHFPSHRGVFPRRRNGFIVE